MDEALFGPRSSGRIIRTTGDEAAFVPDRLPPALDLADLFASYGDAMASMGTLNAKTAQLSNPHLIMRPLQRREALLSSAMEGTHTTSDELALLEAGAAAPRAETREVLNYVDALMNALRLMSTLPICHRLIRDTHAILLGGLPQGRGGNKRPGDYKADQNWIGGRTPASARFVPPPPKEAAVAMNELEAFINRPDPTSIPPLIEAALVHYQFETIHPFADGNGRVGRILIPLILLSRGLIATPIFYPSASMEARKSEYIDRMFAVSAGGEWTQWIRFFLEICRDTCDTSIGVIDRLLALQARYRALAMERHRSNTILILIDHLFFTPVVTAPQVRDLLKVTHKAARTVIGNLEELGILTRIEGLSKPEYFAARDILRVEA